MLISASSKYAFLLLLMLPKTNLAAAPKILAWTRFFSTDLAASLKAWTYCPQHCTIGNRDEISEDDADAIIFHMRNLDFSDMPNHRQSKQNYVFFLLETPAYTERISRDPPIGYFNTSMTYRLSSDYVLPYGRFLEITNDTSDSTGYETWSQEEVATAVTKKQFPILGMISNCETHSKREAYIIELAKYINITMVGGCFGANDSITALQCPRKDKCERELLESHYFYLAFENSVCEDYVTEKFFRMQENLFVPIVLKRSIANKVAPNNSFIATDDFDSPEHLADFLHDLINNTKRYTSYFSWTQSFYKKAPAPITSDVCALCEELIAGSTHNRPIMDHSPLLNPETCEQNFAIKQLRRGL